MFDRVTVRRVAMAIAALITGVLALTGCGRSGNSPGAAEAGAAIDQSPATGDVTIWAFDNEGKTLSALAETFMKENPDAKVTVIPVSSGELPRKLDTAIASGQVPDVIQPSTGLRSFVSSGGIAPVPDGVMDAAAFYQSAVDAVTFDGKAYAVPWYVTVQSLYYRADLARQAGVEAPRTWADLRTFGKALQGAGARHGFQPFTTGVGAWQTILPMIYQAGGTVTEGNQFRFDTPAVIAALDNYQSFFRDGIADAQANFGAAGEIEAALADGSVGAYMTGSYSYEIALRALNGDESKIGVAPLAAGPVSGAGYLGGSGLAVMAESKNKDAAWKFVRYATSAQGEQAAYEISGVLPAARAAWQSGPLADSPVGKTYAAQLEDSRPLPTFPRWTEIRDLIASYGEQLARGVITPENAAAALQSEASRIGTGE